MMRGEKKKKEKERKGRKKGKRKEGRKRRRKREERRGGEFIIAGPYCKKNPHTAEASRPEGAMSRRPEN